MCDAQDRAARENRIGAPSHCRARICIRRQPPKMPFVNRRSSVNRLTRLHSETRGLIGEGVALIVLRHFRRIVLLGLHE